MSIVTALLLAAAGGFVGSALRYLIVLACKHLWGDRYPWGTFVVNVLGCFIIGLFFGLWEDTGYNPAVRALLMAGVCGGFTTFSTFCLDSIKLLDRGRIVLFLSYVATTAALCLSATCLGLLLTK